MPKPLERLLKIRGAEEEQRRRALQAAEAKLNSLEQARESALEMEKKGRARMVEGLISGAVAERQSGAVESASGQRRARILGAHIAAAENETAASRQAFLEKRIERRQAETLVEEVGAREAMEAGRRGQRDIDDWFGTRNHRQGADEVH